MMAVYFFIYSDCNKKIIFFVFLIILYVSKENAFTKNKSQKKKTNQIQKSDFLYVFEVVLHFHSLVPLELYTTF